MMWAYRASDSELWHPDWQNTDSLNSNVKMSISVNILICDQICFSQHLDKQVSEQTIKCQ